MTCRGCRFSTSSIGARSIFFSVIRRWKTGVSRMPTRIQSPIPTITMLSRNGIRHPQFRN